MNQPGRIAPASLSRSEPTSGKKLIQKRGRHSERPGEPPSAGVRFLSLTKDSDKDVYAVAADLGLKGICFSGGGIRSATFNLGVLQGLVVLGKLKSFDYLSTVSGGGYIHQFLASWISCESLAKVEEQLAPLPGPPSKRTTWPDPLRWLRRYSNYLTPQVGLFSADTWVAFSIWLRNTFLNQIVLVSTLLLVLLLPHFYFSSRGRVAHFLLRHGGITAVIILLCFAVASAVIFFSQLKRPPADHCHPRDEAGLGQAGVLSSVFLPILIALFAFCPYLYRASFWSGDLLPNPHPCPVQIMRGPGDSGIVPGSSRLFISHLHALAYRPAPDFKSCSQPQTPLTADPPLRLRGLDDLRAWQKAYSFHRWSPLKDLKQDPSTSWVFTSLLCGIALMVLSSIRAIPPTWKRSIILLAIIGAVGSGYVLIHLSRFAIFAASFLLPLTQVTRVAIPLLPPLALAIVFISIEIAGGLIGNLVDESVREWFARLRAWSFLFGILWFALTACSLLGPALVSYFFYVAKVGKTLWLGWLGTTLISVLAGKSSFTSGTPKDSKSRTSITLNILALIGPPVFIAGLIAISSSSSLCWPLRPSSSAGVSTSMSSPFTPSTATASPAVTPEPATPIASRIASPASPPAISTSASSTSSPFASMTPAPRSSGLPAVTPHHRPRPPHPRMRDRFPSSAPPSTSPSDRTSPIRSARLPPSPSPLSTAATT